MVSISLVLTSLVLAAAEAAPGIPAELLTVAEKSGYKATARHADVVAICRELARRYPENAHHGELGHTGEGRSIPLLVIADPPVRSAEEARKSGKLIAFVIGNIHAGEVCGKEALPMLAREILGKPGHPLLKDLVLVLTPIYNADGNEKVAKNNRSDQPGPVEGYGRRENAQGLDLNRDFIKLDAPETRAFVRFLNEWDPHVFIDAHTTNGSYHRFPMTYGGPKNPAGDPRIIDFARKTFFPELTKSLVSKAGIPSFYYGNFGAGKTEWTTYPAQARYGTTYVGLRNRLSILSEAYKYDPYKTRVLATLDFIRQCLETSASHRKEILAILDSARKDAIEAGRDPKPDDRVALRSKAELHAEPATILGYTDDAERAHKFTREAFKEYPVKLRDHFVATESVSRPFAYMLPPRFAEAVETLRRHGIEFQTLNDETELEVEAYRVETVDRAQQKYEGHHPVNLTVKVRTERKKLPAGMIVVPTAQPLGSLVVYLLEPRSEDGLATWNYFDDGLKAGADFPNLRLPRPVPLRLSRAK